jgi:uncharacterized membrane protein YdcZ (DUF606 family)
MTELNGRLSIAAGPDLTVTIIHLAGMTAALLYLTAAGSRTPGRSKTPENEPFRPWFLAAGTLGIGVVMLSNYGFSKGGLVFTVAGILAGQTLTAFILERIPLFGDRKSAMLQRLVSLLLILPGAVLVAVSSGAPLGAAAGTWGAGALLMLQSLLNSRSTTYLGTPRMVFFSYLSALLVLLPAFFLSGGSLGSVFHYPPYLVIGGGVLGVTAIVTSGVLYSRAPALKVMLAIYLGQLGFSVLLDLVSGRPVPPEFYAGLLLVCGGLASEKIPVPVKWYYQKK